MSDQTLSPLASTSHISLMPRPYGPRVHLDETSMAGTSAASTPFPSDPLPADAPAEFETPTSAANYLASLRETRARAAAAGAASGEPNKDSPAGSAADAATAENELSGEDNAAADADQPTGETEAIDPAEQPPLEMPRSWTKAQAKHWEALPRETQEYVIEQASQASAEVRRVQNETAEKLKGLTAKEQQAEQAIQVADERARAHLKVIEDNQHRDFPDIRSQEDLNKLNAEAFRLSNEATRLLQANDPLGSLELQTQAGLIRGYLDKWRDHQETLHAARLEVEAAETRKTQGQRTAWENHIRAESELAVKAIPELADDKKGPALQKRAADRLVDLGFTREELNDFWTGKEKISVHDHRFQQLVFSDLRLSDLQKTMESAKKVAAAIPPVPSVQRPGAAPPRGGDESAHIQALTRKLETSGSEADAYALLIARRNAAKRRAS